MRGGVGIGGSPSSSAGFCISSGFDEPLDIPAPYKSTFTLDALSVKVLARGAAWRCARPEAADMCDR
eukprot:COSAG02_NODE_20515_length_827_cov_6.061555_2_plen_66_part_01